MTNQEIAGNLTMLLTSLLTVTMEMTWPFNSGHGG